MVYKNADAFHVEAHKLTRDAKIITDRYPTVYHVEESDTLTAGVWNTIDD